jgi:hypothetical protein
MTAIGLDLDPDRPLESDVELKSCGDVVSRRAWTLSGDFRGPTEAKLEAGGPLRAWSINVLDLTPRRPTAP